MEVFLEKLLNVLPDVLGILGVLLVVWYYFLLQIGKCNANSLGFSIGNLCGSVLLLISLWFTWNTASVMIEVIWFMISLFGILRYFYRQGSHKTLIKYFN